MFSSMMLKAGLTLLLVTACLFFAWRIVRILNPKPPRPPKVESFDVSSVLAGNSIAVKTGRKGKRTITITLGGIGVPNLPGASDAAQANLERLAGKTIRAELPKRRLRSEVTPEQEAFMVWFEDHYEKCKICSLVPTKENPGPSMCEEATRRMNEVVPPPEARSDFTTPQAWGEAGLCLQLEMLREGLAMSVGEIPDEWAEAEKAAKKECIGIWNAK